MQIRLFVSFNVKPESTEAFLQAMQQAKTGLIDVPGCHSVEVIQSVDNANNILLSEVWESEEIHDQYALKMVEAGAMDGLKHLLNGAPETRKFYLR